MSDNNVFQNACRVAQNTLQWGSAIQGVTSTLYIACFKYEEYLCSIFVCFVNNISLEITVF